MSEADEDAARSGRRSMLRNAAAVGAVAALVPGLSVLAPRPAAAQAITDADIFAFALNFEYLGAEYYLHAVTGSGLSSNLTSGTGTQGIVIVPATTLVPFQTPALAYYAQRLANDELAHTTFIRTVLGAVAPAEPNIDLTLSWTTLAVAAGLIASGQTFNPFENEVNFLLGAYVLEDVCVTALAGAASLLTNPDNLAYAAGLLGAEGQQAGAIRAYLSNIGAGAATDAISALRSSLSGVMDFGTDANDNPFNISNVDVNGQVFRRTPQQVLAIAYGGGTSGGLFFPTGVNGPIVTA